MPKDREKSGKNGKPEKSQFHTQEGQGMFFRTRRAGYLLSGNPQESHSDSSKENASRTLRDLHRIIGFIRDGREIKELPESIMEIITDIYEPDRAYFYIKNSVDNVYERVYDSQKSIYDTIILPASFELSSSSIEGIKESTNSKEPYIGTYKDQNLSTKQRLVLPILAQELVLPREDVYAFIIMDNNDIHGYSNDDKAMLHSIADIVGAIYNNHLAKSRRDRRIEYLRSVAEDAAISPDMLFYKFLYNLSIMIPCKRLAVWVYNELDDTCVIRSCYAPNMNQNIQSFQLIDSRVVPCSYSVTGDSIHSGKPELANIDYSKKYRNKKYAKENNLEWVMSVPVFDESSKPIATVSLYPYGDIKDFDNQDALDIIQAYISPVKNIIKVAFLLFEESLRDIYNSSFENLLEIEDQAGSWNRIAARIVEQMKCKECSIYIKKDDSDTLYLLGKNGSIGSVDYGKATCKKGGSIIGKVYEDGKPLIYYDEMREPGHNVDLDLFRDLAKNFDIVKSAIFVPILDESDTTIGVLRCSNKDEDFPKYIGRFTKEDLLRIQEIAKIVSNIHSKMRIIKEKEIERERNINGLHHEILSPTSGIYWHISWLERNLPRVFHEPRDISINQIKLKLEDMKQNIELMKVIVATLGRFDDLLLKIEDFSLIDSRFAHFFELLKISTHLNFGNLDDSIDLLKS